MNEKEFTGLLQKYAAGQCTPEEQALVETWYLEQQEQPLTNSIDELSNDLDRIEAGLVAYTKPPKIFNWYRYAAAAVIVLSLSCGGYIILRKSAGNQLVKVNKPDVAPATHVATLTLANGSRIKLVKSLNGKLAQQGGTAISITSDSTLTYSANPDATEKLQYNTLSTIRGQQSPYALVLSDGTKVWLNAESSITFPVIFSGNERLVKVTGEAYFEVSHNAAKPFRVAYKNVLLEDIGTHFNINAYDDEPFIKTTLLEGSVAITESNHKLILKPGQQAASVSGHLEIKDVDTEEAVAWKNGYFLFDNESLQSVMRKISRWYNVSVAYPAGDKIVANYWGSMSRETNISVVLKKLEATNNVRFKIEQNKVSVYKK